MGAINKYELAINIAWILLAVGLIILVFFMVRDGRRRSIEDKKWKAKYIDNDDKL